MARFNYFSIDDDEVRFVLDEHAKLNLYYRASSLKQHSVDRHVALLGLGTHYPDSEPTILCSFSLNAACLAKVVTRSLKQGWQGYDCRRLRPRCKGYPWAKPPRPKIVT
jgi:hypothetical protein